MALSNWDTLAVGQDGQSTNGVLRKSPGGVSVSIYKNWLYISDEDGWTEKGHFAKSTVMEVQHGQIKYKDVKILAVRGPKGGVYCVCFWKDYDTRESDIMFGIGCYGYQDNGSCGEHIDDLRCGKCPDASWVGVENSEVEFLKEQVQKWVESYELSKDQVPETWNTAVRFNQGDMYFAQNLPTQLPASKPGEAEEPLMVQALKPKKDEEDEPS